MLPVSPLIKQAVERGVAYLVTYKSDWIPAVKNGKGEIVKRAHCRTYDRRIVGSIRGNGRSGYVGFREWFFSGLFRTQRLRSVFKRGCIILLLEENRLNYSQGNAACSKRGRKI